MKKLIMMVLGLMCAVGMAGMAIAGNIDSPGAPSAGSGMYTLQNLYDYLTSGTALTVPGSFQEPGAGPGSTMKSTKQIGDDVKALFVQALATTADVKSGVKFFSTVSGSWGVKTGALICPTPIPDWYTTYGPSGSQMVIQIGNMYVARNTNTPGTAKLSYASAQGWAIGLNWLGKTTWRLPIYDETHTICTNKAQLGTYYQIEASDNMACGGTDFWLSKNMDTCAYGGMLDPNTAYNVRAVRGLQ